MTKDDTSTTGRFVYTTASHNGLLPPSPLNHVILIAPANLTPLAVEVIKLTAQFVALWPNTLTQWTNPEFSFLQPQHAHFAYFTALVDEYKSFFTGGGRV
jgi:hypothetical protein